MIHLKYGIPKRLDMGGYGKKLISHDLCTFWTNPLSWRVFKVIPREVFNYMAVSSLKNFLEPWKFQKWEIFNCGIKLLKIHVFKVGLWESIKSEKLPSQHVCDHNDRSTRRTTFPFAFANYICFKEHLEHKQWSIKMRRKFFRGPRAPPSRFQKLSFWSVSKAS